MHGPVGGAGVLLALVASAAGASAQNTPVAPYSAPFSASAVLEFDVASVKPDKSDGRMSRVGTSPDGYSATNVPLKSLISDAYGVRPDLISGGPAWADSVGFDVQAKVAEPDVETFRKLTNEQRGSMLKPLLEERFGLRLRSEMKTLRIYELVIAKGGPKLKQSGPAPPPLDAKPGDAPRPRGGMSMSPGMLNAEAYTMAAFARQLSLMLQRTVLDNTGLTGEYDMKLTWAEEEGETAFAKPQSDARQSTDSRPSLFTALQEQLGLKLQASKGPVKTLVIEQAKMPTDN